MDLLQLNTGDPALHEEVTSDAIHAIVIDDYIDSEQKAAALGHYRDAVTLIAGAIPVFDTLEAHYQQMQALTPEGILSPRPPDNVPAYEFFSADARRALGYFANIRIDTVGNRELYGEIEDMTKVYNEMVQVYIQNEYKMKEMSERIGDAIMPRIGGQKRTRYTALREDLIALRPHIIQLAKTLEDYCRHFPDDRLQELSADPDIRKKVKTLLKQFQFFVTMDDVVNVEDIKEEEKEEEAIGDREIKLISQEVLGLVVETIKELLPHLSHEPGLLLTLFRWRDVLSEKLHQRYSRGILGKYNVPFPVEAGTLKKIANVLRELRPLAALHNLGQNVNLTLERVVDGLHGPTVTREEAKRIFNEALDAAVTQGLAMEDAYKEELQIIEAKHKQVQADLKRAQEENNTELFQQLDQRAQEIQKQHQEIIQKLNELNLLKDQQERQQVVDQIVLQSMGLGIQALAPRKSQNLGIAVFAAAGIAVLVFIGNEAMKNKRRKRKRDL